METVLDLDAERITRVRVAIVEQAAGLGLEDIARAADSATTREGLLDAAFRELQKSLFADDDDIRLSLTVGVMLAPLARELP